MLLTICIVIACILSFVLWTPIMLIIDTTMRQYEVRMWGIASCNLRFEEYKPLLFLNVLGWKKKIDPFEIKEEKRIPKKQKTQKTKKQMSFQKVMRKGKAVLRSFTVKYLYIDMDTDDYVLNGLLYPAALTLSRENRTLRINFVGLTQLKLKIENRLGRILFAYLS